MTIFGTGYREIEWRQTAMHRRLWPLASLEFRFMFRSLWRLLLFIACMGPAIGYLVILLIRSGVWQIAGEGDGLNPMAQVPQPWLHPTNELFYLVLVFNWMFASIAVLTALVSSRAVAKDRTTNGLEILWTRCVTPGGYFLAKWFGSALLIGVPAVLAPTALWLVAWAIGPEPDFLAQTLPFMPRVIAGLILFTLVVTFVPVAISALVRRPIVATTLWALLLAGGTAASAVAERIFRDADWPFTISVWRVARRLAEAVAGVSTRVDQPISMALGALTVMVLLLVVLLRRRLRVTEAMS